MKNIISILVVGALVLSGIGAIAIDAGDNTQEQKQQITTFSVSEPTFSSADEYIKVVLPQQTSYLMEEGRPMLPSILKTVIFQAGTVINNVQVDYDVKEYQLSGNIQPAPAPVALIETYASEVSKKVVMDTKTYTSNELYPAEPYTITYPYGRHQGERCQRVNVKINCQYKDDVLMVPEGEITIKIDYTETPQPVNGDTYDMLIITPEQFTSNFEPLVEHKEAMGITTIVETLEDVYATYDGRNEPEDIKLAIKNAIEEYDIDYVLLGGGRMRQKVDWWLPEFRNNNDDGWESGFASDLYYADVYKNNGTEFEDWDSNENGIFGEWSSQIGHTDYMDFYPDVAIGRIPFHFEFELDLVINKIIKYETEADDSWFKQAVMIAGDTFPGGDIYYEGEMETGYTGDMLEDDGFEIEKLWTSMETLTGVPDVVKAISAGAGFVHFAGHGNPSTWSTHPPNDADVWITGLSWTDMPKLRNREKLPFVIVGGCHNAQFNATLGYIMEGIRAMGIKEYFDMNGSDDTPEEDGTFGPFWLKEWMPRDFCSWLLLKKNGGAIGSVGMTGLGYGYVGQYSGEGLGGWIEPRMFQAYAEQDIDIMGDAHDQAIIDYLDIISDCNYWGGDIQIDRKTIEAFVLLGDPSLMLGGY